MLSKKQKLVKINKFTEPDVEEMTYCVEELKRLLSIRHVNESEIKKLDSIIIQLLSLRERHSSNLITWLKQGYESS